jgi:hypothetical protein
MISVSIKSELSCSRRARTPARSSRRDLGTEITKPREQRGLAPAKGPVKSSRPFHRQHWRVLMIFGHRNRDLGQRGIARSADDASDRQAAGHYRSVSEVKRQAPGRS